MKYSPIAAVLAILALASCKKDNTDSTLPTLGSLSISTEVPLFLKPGTQLSLQANTSELKASDGKNPVIGLTWKVNGEDGFTSTEDIKQSNPAFEYTPEKEGSYTITCTASGGSGYYSSSASVSFTAVQPENTVKGLIGSDVENIGTTRYMVLTAGGKTWLGRNLFIEGKGRSYRNCPVLDSGMGRLYSYEEALTLCPSGWHLPTMAEFRSAFGDADGKILSADLMAPATFQDQELWKYNPDVQINNRFLFNAIPAGYIDATDLINPYQHYGHYAMFWTADEKDGLGTYLYIHEDNPQVQQGQGDKKTLYLSARCVKD